jgi:3-phenylpropionate/trans-cinnamate dioxygenase ferredoxin reductase subunit
VTKRIIIVGAGHGAGQLVATLKQKKFTGQIILIGDESYLPYQRPPLSKKFLAGELEAERLLFKPESFYDDPQIEVQLDTRVVHIDRDARKVFTNHSREFAYDVLVLATGSRVRRIDVPGADLAEIHYLRSIADVEAMRPNMRSGKNVAIVGAGYIGLEVAAVCRQHGLNVTVIEMEDRVMSRVVSPHVSDYFQLAHTNQGVKLLLSTGVTAFEGRRRVKRVITDTEQEVPADFVVVGVGVEPNTELATAASLEVDNGIVVDDRCRTSAEGIYAIGDCTSHPNGIYGQRLRLESVHNALEQAKTAASNICGKEAHYCQVPWFWSDQYDIKLQIAGLSQGYDDVVLRGDPASGSFACLYLRDDVLIAVDAINSPRDFMQSKALIAAHSRLDREKLADAEVALKDLA